MSGAENHAVYLFGGDKPWDVSQWTASDDRVRGGASQSYLTAAGGLSSSAVRFHGNLDIIVLGGAGFASQRTAGTDRTWDLRGRDALVLVLESEESGSSGNQGHHGEANLEEGKMRKKTYTLTLKDELLPGPPDGPEQSSVSWEHDFVFPPSSAEVSSYFGPISGDGSAVTVVMPLVEFVPTYRGRPKPDAKPLDLGGIKRISFMMRSHFGEQEGDFSLLIKSLAAVSTNSPLEAERADSGDSWGSEPAEKDAGGRAGDAKLGEEQRDENNGGKRLRSSWLGWICGSG